MPGPPCRRKRTMGEQAQHPSARRYGRPQMGERRATRAAPRHPENSTPSSSAHLAHILGPAIEDRQNGFALLGSEADDAPADAEFLIARQRTDLIGREHIELFRVEADGDRA